MISLVVGKCSESPTEPERLCSLQIEIMSGNNQKASSYEYLAEPLVFSVKNLTSMPVSDKEIIISVIAGSGMAENTRVTTNNEGIAEVRWKTGTGDNQILKAVVEDEEGLTADVYAIANSDIIFETKWTTGLTFYRNFTEPTEHDGKILETNNFLIFSNGGSDNNKVIFAKIAEEHLFQVMNKFELASSEELGIHKLNSETKIKIYAHTSTNQPGIWRGARNYGILFPSYGSYGWIEMGLKHEMMHMVELLLTGPENFVGASVPSWYTEGIAEHMSNYTAAYPRQINSVSQLNSWISNHNNPLTILNFEDIGNESANEYYNMFGVVVKFILDEKGLGKTFAELKEMYRDIEISGNFNQSFENKLGISVDSLTENIYTMLRSYFSTQ